MRGKKNPKAPGKSRGRVGAKNSTISNQKNEQPKRVVAPYHGGDTGGGEDTSK